MIITNWLKKNTRLVILSICIIVAIVLTAYIIHSIFSESPLKFEYKYSNELGGVTLTKYTGEDLDVMLRSLQK